MNRRQALIGAAALAACDRAPAAAERTPVLKPFPIRRSVNLGNGLEAPHEGDWGYRVEMSHLDLIAGAGFDGIRLPVRWDTHMDARGRVDAAYMARVDEITRAALRRHLKVQLDVHHYEALNDSPDRELPRFRALWRQIGEYFASFPPELLFEALNEPNGDAWTGARVRAVEQAMLEEIRPSNPTRLVVMGGPNWNSIDGLAEWTPPRDAHVVVTAHYYEPHDFTHQDAEFLGRDAPHFGRDWGTDADLARMQQDLARAAAWGCEHGYAMQIGEFGVNERVSPPQRARWTSCVRSLCESLGLGWCYWSFAGGFPIWDRRTDAFIPSMLDALMRQAPAAQ
ncbi:MAG TPA: glycoside hydrolase family 5 protein [Caulobacterales bacterium]|nr:glycoside hydrolase family 5 protein [Caulobacterales bacterium]